MSNYPAFDRDHINSCPICRPKGPSQYLDKYEGYFTIIQNEISLLNISYQSKARLEQTIEDVLRSMYTSLKEAETYPPADFRTEQFLVLESRYKTLLYEYEEERKTRLRVENEKGLLESKTISLIEAQKECANSHLSPNRLRELYSEIDRGKEINRELEVETKDLAAETSTLRAKLRDFEQVNSNFASLKIEYEEKNKQYLQVLKELGYYQNVYRKVCKDSEDISSSFNTFKADYEDKEKRYLQVLKELAYYKEIYEKFKLEYSKDASSINQKYENAIKENEKLEDQVKHLKEKNKRLVKKCNHAQLYNTSEFSIRPEKTDQFDTQFSKNRDKNPSQQVMNQSDGHFSRAENKKTQENLSSSSGKDRNTDRIKDLELKIDELKEKIESKHDPQNLSFFEKKIDELKEKIDKNSEISFKNLTPTPNLNEPGFANDRKKSKELIQGNEYFSKPAQRRTSKKDQTEITQNRRRSSELNLTFSSQMRKSISPNKKELKNNEIMHCGICHRKHGDEYLNKLA